MPRTISSSDSVTNATHAWLSAISAYIIALD
jgi:hypothetical protein